MKTYEECVAFPTWAERLEYLRIPAGVGAETFGKERVLNQDFYQSYEWKQVRDFVIARDLGRDLAMEGFEIPGRIVVHHINPITIQDFLDGVEEHLLCADNLICSSYDTHLAIHFGRKVLSDYIPRSMNDTVPWR